LGRANPNNLRRVATTPLLHTQYAPYADGSGLLFARMSAGMSSQPKMKAHRAHHHADVKDANREFRIIEPCQPVLRDRPPNCVARS
jgi:hypothetical protein